MRAACLLLFVAFCLATCMAEQNEVDEFLDTTLDLQEQLSKARKRIFTQLNSFVEDAVQNNEDLFSDDDDGTISPSTSQSPSPSPSFAADDIATASQKQQALEIASVEETTPSAMLNSTTSLNSTASVTGNASASMMGLNSSSPQQAGAHRSRGIREVPEVRPDDSSSNDAIGDLLQLGEGDDNDDGQTDFADLLTAINSTQLEQAASSLSHIQLAYKALLDKLQTFESPLASSSTSASFMSMQSCCRLWGSLLSTPVLCFPRFVRRNCGWKCRHSTQVSLRPLLHRLPRWMQAKCNCPTLRWRWLEKSRSQMESIHSRRCNLCLDLNKRMCL